MERKYLLHFLKASDPMKSRRAISPAPVFTFGFNETRTRIGDAEAFQSLLEWTGLTEV